MEGHEPRYVADVASRVARDSVHTGLGAGEGKDGFLELISRAQRLIGLNTPFWMVHNTQGGRIPGRVGIVRDEELPAAQWSRVPLWDCRVRYAG